MVVTVLATMLCVAIVISAVAAQRSIRHACRGRAACWNLMGIGCLVVGLVVMSVWSHRGSAVMSQDLPSPQATESAPPFVHREGSDPSQGDQVTPRIELEAPDEANGTSAAAASDESVLDEPASDEPMSPDLISQIEIDFAARPEWVEGPDQDVGQIHQIAVASGPYRRQRTARRELDSQLKQAVDEYINELVGKPAAPEWIRYDAAEVRQRFVAPGHIFDERLVSPTVGVMYQSHALLELGPDFHDEIEQAWRRIVARAQLAKVALVVAAVLGSLLCVFGYFQADTATKGFYTGRLKFVTALAILGLVATSLLLARANPWLWP